RERRLPGQAPQAARLSPGARRPDRRRRPGSRAARPDHPLAGGPRGAARPAPAPPLRRSGAARRTARDARPDRGHERRARPRPAPRLAPRGRPAPPDGGQRAGPVIYIRAGVYAEGPTDYDFLLPFLDRLLDTLAASLFAGAYEVASTAGIDAPHTTK